MTYRIGTVNRIQRSCKQYHLGTLSNGEAPRLPGAAVPFAQNKPRVSALQFASQLRSAFEE